MTKEKFIEECLKTHEIKYGYEKLPEIIKTQDKPELEIFCPVCNSYFFQRYDSHKKGADCPNCKKVGRKKTSIEKFIKESINNHIIKYDYSKVQYGTLLDDVIIICPEHGEFNQKAADHLYGRGCPKCNADSQKKTKEEFIKDAKLVHGDKYDYSLLTNKYITSKEKASIVCKKCNTVFYQTYTSHVGLKNGCPDCAVKSKGELRISEILKSKNIEFEKTKVFNDLRDINQLSYDFYLKEYNLLIEYNGIQHYKNTYNKPLHEFHRQHHHDWLKRKYAMKNGIDLLIIPYTEFDNLEGILDKKLY